MADLHAQTGSGVDAARRAQSWMADVPGGLFVDGAWTEGAGEELEIHDPATEVAISAAPTASLAQVDDAVGAARQAFDSRCWTGLLPDDRARILWRIAEEIERDHERLAHLETLNNGMSLAFARAAVAKAAESFRYFSGWCSKIQGVTSDISGGGAEFHAYTRREPLGVAALITPWNAPFALSAYKVATALAAGCTVVLKPAEQTPVTVLCLGELLQRAGVPAGVVNIVTGRGDTIGAALAQHDDVNKISFTGSTATGKRIIEMASGNLKRVTAELGGKSPILIFGDADIEAAIQGAAIGIFLNSGQICMAGSRVYVERAAYDRVVTGLADAARRQRLGSGFSSESDLGPLISQRQLDRVNGIVNAGIAEGADVVAGGSPADMRGYYMTPTVLAARNHESAALRQEIFGPVVTVAPFDDPDQAVVMANDSEFGLAAGVWTRDISRAHRVAARLEAGTVWLNCAMVTDVSLPFGGYRQSGWGRENGEEGVSAYLESKTVYAAL